MSAEPPWHVTSWPPPAAPARRRRRWLIPVIIAAVVVVVGFCVLVGVVVTSAVSFVTTPQTEFQPAAPGKPGSPVAVDPLECPEACFTADSLAATVPAESAFVAAGVPNNTLPVGTYSPETAGDLYRHDAESWAAYSGTPDECFFATSSAPYAPELMDTGAASEDLVYFMGVHQDSSGFNMMDQSVRIFPDSASATEYMATLASSIDHCAEVTIGPKDNRYSAKLYPSAATPVPDSVAAVGWIREGPPGPGWRAYVEDIQYGNLVMRVRLITDGSLSEYRLQFFAEDRAYQLSGIPLSAPAPEG